MRPGELQQLRTLLLARLEAMRADGDAAFETEDDGAVVRKPDDDMAPLVEMSQVIASNRNRQRALEAREIEAALRRLEHEPDTFGICETCDEPIPLRRLTLRPWTRLCIECQDEQERSDAPRGRKHITDYR